MIHTDTMIWYRLISTPSNIYRLKNIGVVPNIINLLEIGASTNLISRPKTSKEAIVNCSSFLDDVITDFPITHFIRSYDESFNINRDFQNEVIESINKSSNDINFESNIKLFESAIESLIKKDKVPYDKLTDRANILIKEIQKNLMADESGQSITNHINSRSDNFDGIYDLFNMCSNDAFGVELDKVYFFEHELFVKVINLYFLDLEVGRKKKISPNDWNDLMQMFYVKKGEYYWTKETKWLKMVRRLNLQNYLFDGDIYLKRDTEV